MDPTGYQEIIDTFNRQFDAKIKKIGGKVLVTMDENEEVNPVALTRDGLFSGWDAAIMRFLKQKTDPEYFQYVHYSPTLPLIDPSTRKITGLNFLEISKTDTGTIKKLKALACQWEEASCLENRIPDFAARLKKAWHQLNPPQLKLCEPLVTAE